MEEKDRIAAIKLASKRLGSGVDNIIQKANEQTKKLKPKKVKTFSLKTGFKRDEAEIINEQPRHCFSIHKVMIGGTWQTPQHAWAGAELEDPGSPLFHAHQNGSAWALAHPGVQFPKFGPFFISNFGPPMTAAPLNSNAWLNAISSSPWPASYDNMSAFFNWITSQSGGVPMNPCDYVTILEDGPAYILANTVDLNFPAEPIQAWCLQYHDKHYPGPIGNMPFPLGTPGFNSCTDVQGYVATHTLLDAGHSLGVPYPAGEEGCVNLPPVYDPDICGEIGDVNPLTGGILFAKAWTGLNQTPYYYEVAPTDVNQVFDLSGNLVPISPGGTPQGALDNSECSIPEVFKIKAKHTTSEAIVWGPNQTLLSPSQGPQWTNNLGYPEVLAVFNYVIGIGPGSDNPLITSTNYTDWIDVGSEMYHYDENGSPCFLYDAVPLWNTSVAPPVSCSPGAIDTVQSVHHVPIDPLTGLSQFPSGWPGVFAPGMAQHPFELLCIEGNLDLMTWIWNGSGTAFSGNSFCPGHGFVGSAAPLSSDSCPTCSVPVWETQFIKTVNSQFPGWSLHGLEWGVNDRTTNPSTHAFFGSGYKNTLTIDSYTQYPLPPFGHPTLPNRHIAAEEALKYGAMNQHLLEEGEEWHLPSYDEFITMMSAVGPDAIVWNVVTPTAAQQDFIDSWDVNFPTNPISENVYWTSSENDDDSAGLTITGTGLAQQGLDPNDYAIAVKRLTSAPFTEPLFARRCQPLTARPIRRYMCEEESQEVKEYNFRDTHNIWVKGDNDGGNSGGGNQSATPFVSVYTPGGAGSGYAWQKADMSDATHGNGLGGVIGTEGYLISLASTDVMMNDQYEYMLAADKNEAFTNIDQAGNPNGRNASGFVISIWDNQKNFVGKWHYKNAQLHQVRQSPINWSGYITDCSSISNPMPGVNCYDDSYTDANGTFHPGNGLNPPYNTVSKDFPNQISIKLTGPTHLAGPNQVFRYGENHEGRDKRFWDPFLGPFTMLPPSPTSPSGTAVGEIPWTDWQHPYMENVFNGWTSSYAYIKVECEYTQSLGALAFHDINGTNTDIDSMNVVCMRNLFLDTYKGFSPPNPDLNPTTGSLLGVGDMSNHQFNNASSVGGGLAGGYGWQVGNPPHKGNSAFGDLYGINYLDGRRQESSYNTHNLTASYLPWLATHPKHWAFIWHAASPPNSGSLNHYVDLHAGYASCYGYRCHYNVGDVGPAGGIIVCTPDMPADFITPDGVASSCINNACDNGWYYEMSPIDLGEWSKDIVFGAEGSWIDYHNNAFSHPQSIVNTNSQDGNGGAPNTKFKYDTPYTPIGSGIAETTISTHSFLNMNPPGGPYSPPYNQQNAFILCDEYETYDVYGNRYCDWFLPSIQEMWFVCNNLLTAPLSSTGYPFKDLYWTSNEYREDGPGWPNGDTNVGAPYFNDLLPNLTYSVTGGGMIYHPLGVNNPDLNRTNAAYAVNVNEKITGMDRWNLFPTTKAAYVVYKMGDYKVRAMRRFKCPEWVGSGSPGTLTGGGTEIVNTPTSSIVPSSLTTPMAPSYIPTTPPSGNGQSGGGGGGGY